MSGLGSGAPDWDSAGRDRNRDLDRDGQGGGESGTESGGEVLVWYVAYGSNLHAARLARYLRGGRPDGGAQTHPGSRDPRPPRRAVATVLPGVLYFADHSLTWGGGSAFYDPALPGEVPCRAYLVTVGQFSDIAAQEMRRSPGTDLDLAPVLAAGRAELGPGRYETLLHVGESDGHPLLTFTAARGLAGAELNAPTPPYLRTLAAGLAESHGWGPWRTAGYLATRPGAAGHWTPAEVAALLL
ncbi:MULTISPECIES: histone deacetylase [Streptomycetaceae]|uniref:histone deacetylase n=1 Tax=Streptomycetaceae TaxID=2062 RepID=UPI000B320481|nr:histone deacetylase [Streptomyces sp. CB02056]